ncbi:MAG: hypothetical protein RR276_06395, partial [Angelakisella sp.]
GAEYLRQGVALLPASRTSLAKAQQLTAKIRSMGGEATLTEMRFLDEQEHRAMVERFKGQSRDEYRALLLDMARLYESMGSSSPDSKSRALKKRYRSVKERDFFGAESELSTNQLVGKILTQLDLNLDGGWAELVADLKQGCRDLGKVFTVQPPNERSDKDDSNGNS